MNTTLQLLHSAGGLLLGLTSGVAVEQWGDGGLAAFFNCILHLSLTGHMLLTGRSCDEMILLVQAHGRTLVHAHVGITQEAACLALDALWVQRVQLLWTHF